MFGDANFYEGNFFNIDPDFKNGFENLMQIGEDSGANGIGSTLFSSQVPNDILGIVRGASPDAGAFESIPFED